jgi:anti-anti-sigma factor
MAAKNFSVRQDEHGTYQLEGELSIHDLEEFRAFLDNTLKGGKEIAISLSKVRYIDTAALQLLIAFMKRFESDVKLRISAVSKEVEDILSLSGLKAALM